MNIITEIREVTALAHIGSFSDLLVQANTYDGYLVRTDCDVFNILIEDGHMMTERYGCNALTDDIYQFIGAELLSVIYMDGWTGLGLGEPDEPDYFDPHKKRYGGFRIVIFHTDRGPLLFSIYNIHSGVCGHDYVLAKNLEILILGNM